VGAAAIHVSTFGKRAQRCATDRMTHVGHATAIHVSTFGKRAQRRTTAVAPTG
jgi:hypothetical protein